MASIDINRIRQVLQEHQQEIAAELGLVADDYIVADHVRNANANPDSPLAARTGRIVSRSDIGLE